MTDSSEHVEIVDLGRISYADAYRAQRARLDHLAGPRPAIGTDPPNGAPPSRMTVFLLEHVPPVITVSRRHDATTHLLAPHDRLTALGIEVVETDRGGDITYHGPGQIVAYAVLDLKRLRLGVSQYVRWLEAIVINVLGEFGIEGVRDCALPGVWINSLHHAGPKAKICAVGVRISRWITMHGLALNVSTDLSHFDTIVPCGLADRRVTSMAEILSAAICPDVSVVKQSLHREFVKAIDTRIEQLNAGDVAPIQSCATE